MAIVRELLEVRQLSRLKILTGIGGMENRVGTVTVMEVPGVTKYLRGEDFLITSLYLIGSDIQKQCELVLSLQKTKSACLAIKLGKYTDQLSDEMLEIADRNNLPIILIPDDMTYIHIIMNVMNIILAETNIEGILERFIQDILFENYIDEKIMIERGRLLNINVEYHAFQTIVIKPVVLEQFDDYREKMLKFMTRQLASYIRELKAITSCSSMSLDKHTILLLEGKGPEELESCITFFKAELLKRMNNGIPQSTYKMGIGKINKGLTGIRKSYITALKALKTGAVLKEKEDIYLYQEMEIYCQLSEMLLQNPSSIFERLSQKIDSKELMITLECYFENDCNMEQTARQLFTHKNTIKYRINKIKERTGLDMKKQEDNFKIFLMLLEKKLNKNK